MADIEKGHVTNYNNEKLLEYFNEKIGFVALADNEIVGYMIVQQQSESKTFYINSVHVLKEFQGIGLGKMLFSTAIKKAKDLGYKKVWLDVMTKNKKTVKWYYNQKFVFNDTSSYKMGNSEVEILRLYKII